MRTFQQVYNELDIEEFLDSGKGTLYCGPSAPAMPEIMVRHFDGKFSKDLVEPFVSITDAARGWIEEHPGFSKFVELELLLEVGIDFISRTFHIYRTSLSIYDDRTDRSEVPKELNQMREALLEETGDPKNEKEQLLEKILKQSILEPASKTYFNWNSRKFCIIELKLTRDDLLKWQLMGKNGSQS